MALENAADKGNRVRFRRLHEGLGECFMDPRTVLIKALKPLCIIATREGLDGPS